MEELWIQMRAPPWGGSGCWCCRSVWASGNRKPSRRTCRPPGRTCGGSSSFRSVSPAEGGQSSSHKTAFDIWGIAECKPHVNSHLRLDVGDFTPGKFKLTQWDLDEIKQIMQTLKKTNQHKKGTICVYEYLFIAMSYFFIKNIKTGGPQIRALCDTTAQWEDLDTKPSTVTIKLYVM